MMQFVILIIGDTSMKDRKHNFRNYQSTKKSVKDTYKHMQENKNLFFVKSMKRKYAQISGYTDITGNKIRKPFSDVFSELDKLIDESDPDTNLPQIYHSYQTGEALKTLCKQNDLTQLRDDILIKDLFSNEEWNRLPSKQKQIFSKNLHEFYPEIKDWSWLPLIGFLHDLGKVLATKKWGSLPQWAVVGDTFPVGAPFSDSNVYSEFKFYADNADLNIKNNKNETFGIYKKHCGFDKIEMSWGHDEYCYSVLSHTLHYLPDHALYLVRFHSFYAWHSPRNGVRGYEELASDNDWIMLPLLKAFQKSDLYSKKDELPNKKELQSFYLDLIERFVPGRVKSDYNLRPAKIRW